MKTRLAKKVNEYFKFVQDQLKQNYPNGEVKSPLQIKDKKERENFFSQVKTLWKNKKEAAVKADPKLEKSIEVAIKKFGPELVKDIQDGKNVNSKTGVAEIAEFANQVWTQILPVLKSTGLSSALGSNPVEVAQSLVGLIAANYSWKAMFGRDRDEENGLKSILKGKTFLDQMTDLVKAVFPSLSK